jgi:hypothetical protein
MLQVVGLGLVVCDLLNDLGRIFFGGLLLLSLFHFFLCI